MNKSLTTIICTGVFALATTAAFALPQKTVVQGSKLSNYNKNVKNTAIGGSKVNSGIEAKGSVIKGSKISNYNKNVKNTAIGGSKVNSGINLGD